MQHLPLLLYGSIYIHTAPGHVDVEYSAVVQKSVRIQGEHSLHSIHVMMVVVDVTYFVK
jgi:hypothetical protein